MTKLETVKRFKSAAEIEQEATRQAQALADKTAAEMLAMAEAMTAITTAMHDSYLKAGKAALAAAQAARESAKQADAAAQTLEQSVNRLQSEVQRSRSKASRYLELLAAVVLSAIVGSGCQHLLAPF